MANIKEKIKDAVSYERYILEVRIDSHGCVVQVGDATVVLDLAMGNLNVYKGDDATERIGTLPVG